MKIWNLMILMLLIGAGVLCLAVACGDDDDDDDDDAIKWDCDDACGAIYDDCDSGIPDTDGGGFWSKSECIDACEDDGGVNNCGVVCLDNYDYDNDCQELIDCIYDCVF